MRIIILLTVLTLFSSFTKGQDNLDKLISNGLCKCFTAKPPSKDEFVRCLYNEMQNNFTQIMKECFRIYKDTSEESANKYGQSIYNRLSVDLIYSCDSYYKFMNETRYEDLKKLNKDSIYNIINWINNKNSLKRDKDFFLNRGFSYFQVSNIDAAIKDFDSSMLFTGDNTQALLFKAWGLEILKKYDESYKIYNELVNKTKRNDFNVFAAIVKRKKTAYNNTFMQ